MSLLFNRHPVVINADLAEVIGLNEAIVLQQVKYWLDINEKEKRNFKDGRYWTYDTIEEWHKKKFYFWSVDTVKRTFAKLEKMGLLLTSKSYNSRKGDTTKWYSIDEDKLMELALIHRENNR